MTPERLDEITEAFACTIPSERDTADVAIGELLGEIERLFVENADLRDQIKEWGRYKATIEMGRRCHHE